MKTLIVKDETNTTVVQLRNKWQTISLRLFDRLLHSNLLIWSDSKGCYCGLVSC